MNADKVRRIASGHDVRRCRRSPVRIDIQPRVARWRPDHALIATTGTSMQRPRAGAPGLISGPFDREFRSSDRGSATRPACAHRTAENGNAPTGLTRCGRHVHAGHVRHRGLRRGARRGDDQRGQGGQGDQRSFNKSLAHRCVLTGHMLLRVVTNAAATISRDQRHARTPNTTVAYDVNSPVRRANAAVSPVRRNQFSPTYGANLRVNS